jgi:hypothetical protein
MHSSKMVSTGTKKKPEIVEFYNKTNGGVDVADQMIEAYSTKYATRCWRIVVFCNILDMSALNAYTLRQALFPTDQAGQFKRKVFLKMLRKDLCKPHSTARSPLNPNLDNARRLLGMATDQPPIKRAQCHVCPCHLGQKSSLACSNCLKIAALIISKLFAQAALSNKKSPIDMHNTEADLWKKMTC